jgi:hypothetical protein
VGYGSGSFLTFPGPERQIISSIKTFIAIVEKQQLLQPETTATAHGMITSTFLPEDHISSRRNSFGKTKASGYVNEVEENETSKRRIETYWQ